MKHIWVVESSGGRKWWPHGHHYATKKLAKRAAKGMTSMSPGLKWRVAKYERVK
jgi:hypothetical protein